MNERRLRVDMISPTRSDCGVADYTRYLTAELNKLADVRVMEPSQYDPASDADIVHIQHQYFVFGGVAPWKNRFKQFADRLSVPAVMTVHEFVSPAGSLPVRTVIKASNRAQFSHPAIERLIVHTNADRDRMIEAGFAADRTVLIRHGVPRPPEMPGKDDAKHALGLEGRFVVTIFGYISQRKGHLMAVQALSRLDHNVMLLIAGGRHFDDASSYTSDVEKAIDRLGLGERVNITGYLAENEVAKVMASTDLVLAPFLTSSGSGSLALAMGCGKAIVASDIHPHIEISDEARGVLSFFKSGDAVDLADTIQAIRNSPDTHRKLEEASKAYAEEHSYSRAAEATLDLYREVLAGARK